MNSQDVKRWLSSRYATSWQLMVFLVANYFVNGQLVGDVQMVEGGPPNYVIDLYNGFSMAGVLLLASVIHSKNVLTKSIVTWCCAAGVSMLVPPVALPLLYPAIDVSSESYRALVVVAGLGFFQAVVVQGLITMLLASFSESRMALRDAAAQTARLSHLKATLEQQILEIRQRLEVQVSLKLNALVDGLISNLSANASPTRLAELVRDALDEGVRPLSWQIVSNSDSEPDFSKAKPPKRRLRDWFGFKIEFGRATSVALATVVMVTFDPALVNFVFGPEATLLCIIAITVIAVGTRILLSVFRKVLVNGFVSVLLVTVLAGLFGSSFIALMHVFRGLSRDLTEFAVVISFMQITFAVSLFRLALEQRKAAVRDALAANAELEVLNANLKQRAWTKKQRLARIVHGPVQSMLFSVYLELSKADEINTHDRKLLSERVLAAKHALDSAGDVQEISFAETIDQLTSGWGESLSFNTSIDPAVLLEIDRSVVSKSCAIEVLREAINNAAKYGTGEVAISVSRSGPDLVKVTIANPVAPDASINSSGYGSKVLDEVTHSWNLEVTRGQATLTALVAIVRTT